MLLSTVQQRHTPTTMSVSAVLRPHPYDALGFDTAAQGDEVFCQLVLARVSEPTSKQDSLRVLTEVGIDTASIPR